MTIMYVVHVVMQLTGISVINAATCPTRRPNETTDHTKNRPEPSENRPEPSRCRQDPPSNFKRRRNGNMN